MASDTPVFELDGQKFATGLLLSSTDNVALMARVAEFEDKLMWEDDAIKNALVINGASRHILDRERHGAYMRNQGEIGSCCPCANTTGIEQTRQAQGMPHVALAHCFTYTQISGGKDSGATLPDAFTSTQQMGATPYLLQIGGMTKRYPNDVYSSRQVPADIHKAATEQAKRFRGVRLLKLPLGNFEKFCRAAATGIAKRWPMVWAWQVENIGMRLNKGYMQLARGAGNHANCIHSGKWVGGKTLVHGDNQNSWGPVRDPMYGPAVAGWGENGYGLTTMEGLFACAHIHPPYFIISVGVDPNDPAFAGL